MVLHRSVYFATGSVYVVKMWVVSRFSAWATVTTFWHGFGYVNIGFAHLHKCRRDNLGGKLLLNLAAGLRKCHAYLVSKSSALFSLPPPPLSLWKCRTLTELSAKLFSWFLSCLVSFLVWIPIWSKSCSFRDKPCVGTIPNFALENNCYKLALQYIFLLFPKNGMPARNSPVK